MRTAIGLALALDLLLLPAVATADRVYPVVGLTCLPEIDYFGLDTFHLFTLRSFAAAFTRMPHTARKLGRATRDL